MRTTGFLSTAAFALFLAACGTDGNTMVTPPDFSQLDADCTADPARCPGSGICNNDQHCAGILDTPRCDVVKHLCVTCLPASDNCPAGQVCRQVNTVWTCVNSCVGNADCQKLGGGSLCCGSTCVNPATDVTNCGACGQACPPVNNGTAGCVIGNCVIAACNPGYADCDQAFINGCEVTTGNDPLNCGKCLARCTPFANGLPTCTNGACAAICQPGFADCDNNTMNGCEIDTTFDIKNCGGCSRVCGAPANAEAACDQGKCGFRCKIGFADCDANPANGCETNAGSDVSNCGHCGNICPLRPNAAAASCVAGQCVNTCNMGFGDCDNQPANGCEANLQISLAACGACGKPCKNNNAVATCAMGVCTLQCNVGFVDCNMDPKDGCEANLLTDNMNCGACGMVCPQNLPACSAGKCINGYFPVGVQQNIPVGMMSGWAECWKETYGAFGSLAQLQVACGGTKIALACRPTGNPTLTLMAWANRTDVFNNVPAYCACCANTAVRQANGTGWYYDSSWALGFVAGGDTVNLCSCDTQSSGANDAKRLCVHTSGNAMSTGYRCGNTFDYGGGTERLFYSAP